MKLCIECKTLKSTKEFNINTRVKSGLVSFCKKCHSEKNKIWYLKNKNKVKERHKKYCEDHKDQRKECSKQWALHNPEKVREQSRRKDAKRKHSKNISRRIRESIKKGSKGKRHWEDLVGFTVEELKKHLEKLFTPEMTWKNYGVYWHIDHKIPISKFNFKTSEDLDFRRCWSLNNLQPLEAKENLKKHAKIDKPFQPSLILPYGV